MTVYSIYTPGPIMETDQPNLDAAIEYAKCYMPMKRGWRHKVVRSLDGREAVISAWNSKGRKVNSFHVVRGKPRSRSSC